MAVRSALRNRLRTKSAASTSSWSPMPIRRRGKLVGPEVGRDVAQALLTAVGSSRPEPQLAHRQAEIVAHDQQVGQGQLVEPHRLTDRAATEVHERLGLQEQDAPKVDLGLGELTLELAGRTPLPMPPRARRSTSSKPMLCRVPWYLTARVAQADHQFHRRQRRGSRPVSPRPSVRGRDRREPGLARRDQRPRSQSVFLFFFLALGLDDLGLRRCLGPAASGVGSSSVPRTTT